MSSFALKCIALICMVIDHTGAILFPELRWMRYLGRLAFPIYAFLIVEGYVHTRNVRKYILRLAVFAVISDVPFDIAAFGMWFDPGHQNVFFTLLMGLLALVIIDRFTHHTFLQAILVASLAYMAQLLHTDYRYIGVCLIVVFYIFRDRLFFKITAALNAIIPFSSNIEFMACTAILPISLYNGKRGRFSWKPFFYIFYPAHLLLLAFIRRKIYGIWTY